MRIDQDRKQITVHIDRDEALLSSELIALAQGKGCNSRGSETIVFTPVISNMIMEGEIRLSFRREGMSIPEACDPA